jgi:hypothetical protein
VIPDRVWMEDGPVARRLAIRAWYEGLLAPGRTATASLSGSSSELMGTWCPDLLGVLRSKHNGIDVAFDVPVVNGIAGGKIVRQEYYFGSIRNWRPTCSAFGSPGRSRG